MGKVDRAFGIELRRKRKRRGFSQDSLGAELNVAEKTVGKWERGEAQPSPSNRLALERLGLIDPWQVRNALSEELDDRVRQTFGCAVSDLPAGTPDVRNEPECILIAYFRRLPSRLQWSVLDIVSSMIPPAMQDE